MPACMHKYAWKAGCRSKLQGTVSPIPLAVSITVHPSACQLRLLRPANSSTGNKSGWTLKSGLDPGLSLNTFLGIVSTSIELRAPALARARGVLAGSHRLPEGSLPGTVLPQPRCHSDAGRVLLLLLRGLQVCTLIRFDSGLAK